jgi:hypothetical protein
LTEESEAFEHTSLAASHNWLLAGSYDPLSILNADGSSGCLTDKRWEYTPVRQRLSDTDADGRIYPDEEFVTLMSLDWLQASFASRRALSHWQQSVDPLEPFQSITTVRRY